MLTISVIKADIGGFVGHSASHPDILELGQEWLTKAQQKGLLIDSHVSHCGDDMFLVMTHERGEERHVENVAEALRSHLGWTQARASAVLARSLGQGLVRRDGEALSLTGKGRIEAEALLEPWKRGG